ncbi:MAG TPA: type II/IV secretion system ATPase subunit [archaeon]|nr:type II/IV secretion system ATPase subunit [archaeon]
MVYDVIEIKEGVMRIDAMGAIFGASIEDSDVVMAQVIDKILAERKVSTIILVETREYEYDSDQTEMLAEIADSITEIMRERKLVSVNSVGGPDATRFFPQWYPWLYNTIAFQLRGDPVGAYVNLVREVRHLNILMGKIPESQKVFAKKFLLTLQQIQEILENTKLVSLSKDDMTGYNIGDRSVYRKFFHPIVRPNFMYTKYLTKPPSGEIISKYNVADATIEIFRVPGKVRPYYMVTPPEFKLSEAEYTLLDDARRALEQRKPAELEMKDQQRAREIIKLVSVELLRDLSDLRKIEISEEKIENMAEILTRYTVGLGVIELMLADENIQDININSPLGKQPIFVLHQKFDECETNLVPTKIDGDRWATRFKLLSGRPLDEANPVLDTEVSVPGGVARVAAIGPTLSPEGLAFALRRHRFRPWTFPLFINEGMFNPLFAGLMWFFTSYGRTILIAGTRGAGKTSVLGSLMLQVIPYYRIITSEDTLELPVEALRNLGYNIERLKSRSVITHVEVELSAEDAIRTALRLGDSCLFIGEIRSTEAKALFEAMRVGALANIVAGTIHGESAYGVFDRVVNDLNVPATSFKATDLVVVANKIRSSDGLRSMRRVVEVTEVRKHWQKDPVEEHGFVNLLEYSSKEDTLKPTDVFLNGESIILNEIARRVPGWAGRWDAVWDNINLRAKILKTIVDIANQTGKKDLLEAETIVASNQQFNLISEKIRKEVGEVVPDRVYSEWSDWFKKIAKV